MSMSRATDFTKRKPKLCILLQMSHLPHPSVLLNFFSDSPLQKVLPAIFPGHSYPVVSSLTSLPAHHCVLLTACVSSFSENHTLWTLDGTNVKTIFHIDYFLLFIDDPDLQSLDLNLSWLM